MRRVVVLGVVAAGCGGSGDPTLTIVRAGTAAEGVVTSAAGIACGDDCSISVPAGVIVPLDAVVPRGVRFMGWNGGGCTGADLACAVTVTEDVTVTVTFDEKREIIDLPIVGNPDVDIVVVTDNSGGMAEERNSLIAAFPALLDVLEHLEGGLPDLHIGVVTPDMGTLGVSTGDARCDGSDDGTFVKGHPSGTQCPEVDGNFITATNVTGTLEDAFACMASVGDDGCGFEQPLEAMRAALDDNPANAGFLRATASLGVILLVDEDDCSAKNPAFFGPESAALGPLDSFRCFEKGIRCAEGRDVDLRVEGPKTDCVPDEATEYLQDLQTRYVDFIRGLKASSRNIVVAAIVGDAAPVEVGRRTPTGSTSARADLIPSCTYTDTSNQTNTADPGIRLRWFTDQFGTNGIDTSVCRQDYLAAMVELGVQLRRMVGYPCIEGALYAPDACDLAQVVHPGTANETSQSLPFCTPTVNNPPCWHTISDPAVCGARPRLVVEGAIAPPTDAAIIGSCRID
jgi:hypothetical protein